jgi:pimeloyl-ACP methyl ester carboxylesterase
MKILVPVLYMALLGSPVCAASEEPIKLVTPTGTLFGTLNAPAPPAKVPVVLLIAGSGPTDRDGNSAGIQGKNNNLQMLAASLAEAGFASVRYDKRGVAASVGAATKEADLRFDDYVNDAAAWVSSLSANPRFSGVAIVGHSEGSLIGMIAAQQSPKVPFVSISGAAAPAGKLLREQLKNRLPLDLAAQSDAIIAGLEARKLSADVPPQLQSLYRVSVQPYMISWFKYVPTRELDKLTAPCLILQGDTDIQVAVTEGMDLYAAHKSCELKIVNGMNHLMKMVPAMVERQVASYGDPTLPLAPVLVSTLTTFLGKAFIAP